MTGRRFIKQELLDLIRRTEFEPYVVHLVDGRTYTIGEPEGVTLLRGGVVVYVQGGSRAMVPYSKIVSLETIFDV